jgi:glycosyltransferase involved in cell wall biosynthesis
MTSVSVLVPAAGATDTIVEAVESILHCELARAGKVEVVVAPDDESREYCALLSHLPDVLVLEPTSRRGPGFGRNRARTAASGEWFTLLDADDLVVPGYLDSLTDLASRSTAQCVFSRTRYEAVGGAFIRELPLEPQISASSMASFAGSIRALFRCELWIEFPDTIAEDVWVESNLLDRSGGRAPLANTIYRARVLPNSLCSSMPQDHMNAAYRVALSKSTNRVTTEVFAAKLQWGLRYRAHLAAGGQMSFHEFVAAAGPTD